jgi:hypothetical protein
MPIRIGTKQLSQYLELTDGRVIQLTHPGVLKRAKDVKSGKELRGCYDLAVKCCRIYLPPAPMAKRE